MTWLQKLGNISSSVSIQDYATSLQNKLHALVLSSQQQQEKAAAFNLDLNKVTSLLSTLQYPNPHEIVQALQSTKWDALWQCYKAITDWTYKNVPSGDPRRDASYEISVIIRTYASKISPSVYTRQDAENDHKRLVQETAVNMQKIKEIIDAAIGRLQHWSGSQVSIKAGWSDQSDIGSASYAHVAIGNADFMISEDNGKIELDDILEAGDDEFFTDPKIAHDYFSLVKELQNPGSSQKNKIIVLYTARPSQDRQLYMNNTIPSNIFLTNSYDRAEGLAVDLSGPRDIWKVWIEEKYLLATLDAGRIKDYQAIGADVIPVRKIELITPTASM